MGTPLLPCWNWEVDASGLLQGDRPGTMCTSTLCGKGARELREEVTQWGLGGGAAPRRPEPGQVPTCRSEAPPRAGLPHPTGPSPERRSLWVRSGP